MTVTSRYKCRVWYILMLITPPPSGLDGTISYVTEFYQRIGRRQVVVLSCRIRVDALSITTHRSCRACAGRWPISSRFCVIDLRIVYTSSTRPPHPKNCTLVE